MERPVSTQADLEESGCALQENAEGRVEAIVPSELLWALVKTPPYTTWQGERWLFHCGRPMVFVGEHTPEELESFSLTERAEADLDAFRH